MTERILDTSECLLDEWTAQLVKEYPTLLGQQVPHIVCSVASIIKLDISHIESRHASMRRMLASRARTDSFEFQDIGSQWVWQQCRVGARRAEGADPRRMKKRAVTNT